VGILSDRVLGMPVAAAYSSTLPQNCCVQLCGKGMELSSSQRALVGRCCFVAALNLLMLGAVSDALGSNMAVWQASSRGTSQVRLGPATPTERPQRDKLTLHCSVNLHHSLRNLKTLHPRCPFADGATPRRPDHHPRVLPGHVHQHRQGAPQRPGLFLVWGFRNFPRHRHSRHCPLRYACSPTPQIPCTDREVHTHLLCFTEATSWTLCCRCDSAHLRCRISNVFWKLTDQQRFANPNSPLSSISAVGRSCELCCVPCNFWSCDMPCRNSFSLALSLLFTAIAIPLNAWPCIWRNSPFLPS